MVTTEIEKSNITEKPWWNRPLIGRKTLTEYLLINTRLKIPPQSVTYHNQVLDSVEQLSLTLKALFNDRFLAADFLIYARIEEYFTQARLEKKHYFLIGKYFFQTVLDNLDSLIKLTELENKCTDPVLLGFCLDSLHLIKQEHHKLIFQAKLKKSYLFYRLQVEEEQSVILLKQYYRHLFNLSQIDELLYFFSALKKENLDHWHLFSKIKNFVHDNEKDSIDQLKPFLLLTKTEKNLLIEIGYKIIRIKKSSPHKLVTIARILQYTALDYKYKSLYPQFRLFLQYLKKWGKRYYYLLSLRKKYTNSEYSIPSTFKTKPHGFELYKNYHDYLDYHQITK